MGVDEGNIQVIDGSDVEIKMIVENCPITFPTVHTSYNK